MTQEEQFTYQKALAESFMDRWGAETDADMAREYLAAAGVHAQLAQAIATRLVADRTGGVVAS